MRKIYYLSSCSTCRRILSRLGDVSHFDLQDIKHKPLTTNQLDELYKLAGSYEKLFSRRAVKYRALGLHEKDLSEPDYKEYLLKEYTFLKRPVIVIDDQIFIGNSKKQVEAAEKAIRSL